jgi:PAP2 superfamily
VWLRFSPIVEKGKPLDEMQKQQLFDLMTKSVNDASSLVAPIKLDPPAGRQRPFMRFSNSPTCLEPNDLVAGHKENDYKYRLRQTGSYPSTHATIGILWAFVLAELYPRYKEELLEKGISFGESRAICGFHFESDVSAGRVAGEVLFNKLRANKQFARDLQDIKHQIERSRP